MVSAGIWQTTAVSVSVDRFVLSLTMPKRESTLEAVKVAKFIVQTNAAQ